MSSQLEPHIFVCCPQTRRASVCKRLFEFRSHICISRVCEIQDSPVHDVKTFGLMNGHRTFKAG